MIQRPSQRRRQYALREEPQMTLLEVASVLGITAEAVRQTEYRALKKLRTIMAERGLSLKDFID